MPVEKRDLQGCRAGLLGVHTARGILQRLRAPLPPALYTGEAAPGASELLTAVLRQGWSSPPDSPGELKGPFLLAPSPPPLRRTLFLGVQPCPCFEGVPEALPGACDHVLGSCGGVHGSRTSSGEILESVRLP